MQTTRNLGQVAVMAVCSAMFHAFTGSQSTGATGYGAAFALLLVPSVTAALLAVRARCA